MDFLTAFNQRNYHIVMSTIAVENAAQKSPESYEDRRAAERKRALEEQKAAARTIALLTTALIVIGSAFIPTPLGYGAWLLGTIPLAPVIFFFVYLLANR